MAKPLRSLVSSLIIFEAIFLASATLMDIAAGERPHLEDAPNWLPVILLALVPALICFPICRALDRIPGTLAGLGIGMIVPILVGWIRAQIVDRALTRWPAPAWAQNSDPLSLWISGLELAIPSAIAGAIVGFLLSQRTTPYDSLSNS